MIKKRCEKNETWLESIDQLIIDILYILIVDSIYILEWYYSQYLDSYV